MTANYQRARTQHGHWLPTINVSSSRSTPTSFLNFINLPFELQTQIWQYAAISEQSLQFPATLDTDQVLQTTSIVDGNRNNTAYFFAGQIQLSSAFLRGLETVRIHRNDAYGTLYAALWRRLSVSSQYDVSRCLAQTCRLARLVVLKEIKARINSIMGEDGDERSIYAVRVELINELDELISSIRRCVEAPHEQG